MQPSCKVSHIHEVVTNVDAAFDINSSSGDTGAIVRDHFVSFVLAGRWNLQHVEDAATAETCALHDGLLLVGEIRCNKWMVESDCSEVVEVMQNGSNSLGAGKLIWQLMNLLSFLRSTMNYGMVIHLFVLEL